MRNFIIIFLLGFFFSCAASHYNQAVHHQGVMVMVTVSVENKNGKMGDSGFQVGEYSKKTHWKAVRDEASCFIASKLVSDSLKGKYLCRLAITSTPFGFLWNAVCER